MISTPWFVMIILYYIIQFQVYCIRLAVVANTNNCSYHHIFISYVSNIINKRLDNFGQDLSTSDTDEEVNGHF